MTCVPSVHCTRIEQEASHSLHTMEGVSVMPAELGFAIYPRAQLFARLPFLISKVK